jgi:hypothetical protein
MNVEAGCEKEFAINFADEVAIPYIRRLFMQTAARPNAEQNGQAFGSKIIAYNIAGTPSNGWILRNSSVIERGGECGTLILGSERELKMSK